MDKNKVLLGVVVLVVLVLGVSFPRGKTVVERIQNQFGAVPTLDGVDEPSTSIGGVRTFYKRQSLTATSSTICSIRNPYATSTVNALSLNITSGILGANNFSVSTSTNSYATSTQSFILDKTIPTGAQLSVAWYPGISTTTSVRLVPSTDSTGAVPGYVAPGEYVNFRLATTTGAGALAAYYQGTCSVEFRQI